MRIIVCMTKQSLEIPFTSIYLFIFATLILISEPKNFSYRSIIIDFETPVGFIEKSVVVCLFIDVARTQTASIGNL